METKDFVLGYGAGKNSAVSEKIVEEVDADLNTTHMPSVVVSKSGKEGRKSKVRTRAFAENGFRMDYAPPSVGAVYKYLRFKKKKREGDGRDYKGGT